MIKEREYLQDSLFEWVAAVMEETGRADEVRWRFEEGVRPPPPFLSIEFVGSETPGTPNYGKVNLPDERRKIRQYVRRTMAMYGFGKSANDLLEYIRTSIWFSEYIYLLRRKGLVINDATEVKEIPHDRSNDVENCAFFEFVLTYIRIVTDKPGWIESVELSSNTRLGNFIVSSAKEE